jgi:hypothetical protein
MRPDPASSASRIARVFSTSGSVTTRGRGSASSCRVTLRSGRAGQGQRGKLAITQRDAVQLARYGVECLLRSCRGPGRTRFGPGGILQKRATSGSFIQECSRSRSRSESSPRHPREKSNLAKANVMWWTDYVVVTEKRGFTLARVTISGVV